MTTTTFAEPSGGDDHATSATSALDAAVTSLLAASVAPTDVDRLRLRLAVDAEAEDLLDLAHRAVDSPLGPLLVVVSRAGVVRIAFDVEGHDRVLAELAAEISPRLLAAPRRTDAVARQLDEYFSRRRRRFDVPVDLQLVRGFRRAVVEALPTIGYGSTRSYADVAALAGRPRAVRAVGSACSHNPVPIVVPCHRVVRSDGTIGQYLGGTAAKLALLEMEASA